MVKDNVILTQGKRKTCVARATLKPGKGKFIINGQAFANYSNDMSRLRINEPLVLAEDSVKKIDLSVNVNGGGVSGQADAIRLAVARALVQHDKKLEKVFNDYDRLLLVADVRRKETCKPNDSKARAKRQKSYRWGYERMITMKINKCKEIKDFLHTKNQKDFSVFLSNDNLIGVQLWLFQ